MRDIKTKEHINRTIKTIDKADNLNKKLKENLVEVKDKNSYEYASEKYTNTINTSIGMGNYAIKKEIKNSKDIMSKKIKEKNKFYKKKKNKFKQSKEKIKKVRKTLKNSEKVAKETTKTIKETSKVVVNNAKETIKISISIIKMLVEGLKELIGLIIAGGWISVIIIMIICIVGIILGSSFGIFFANENSESTIPLTIRAINSEVNKRIDTIKKQNDYDDIVIEISYSNWKEIIAIYSIKANNSSNEIPMILSDKNLKELENIFWDMNDIKYEIRVKQSEINQNEIIKILYITFEKNTIDDLVKKYNFSEKDKEQFYELTSSKYDQMWEKLLYGKGNEILVNIALQEEGYIHGDKYWKWYGFNSRVEWCAVFVSWVANEAGVLNVTIPKYSFVTDMVNWYKERNQFEQKGYIPNPGDIIFFDWESDGKPNHVGIVEKVEDGIIYTIEGNSVNDGVRRKYSTFDKVLFGFGKIND